MAEADSLELYSKEWAANNFKNHMVNKMNRFRKVTAQEGSGFDDGSTLSPAEKASIESGLTNKPFEFKAEIYKQFGRNIDPAKTQRLVNDLIAQIENYDKTFQFVRTFYNDNMPDDFYDYLDKMHKEYNMRDMIAAKFFNDAWNIYKTKFSNTKGFSKIFNQLIESYGPNIPTALSELKSLIDKLPSALGRVDNEESFIDIMIKLAKNPNDPAINKLYEQFVINEFIRDLMLGKTDEKLMASNVVDTKAMIKELGRPKEDTIVEQKIKDNYMAYNLFIDKTYEKKIQEFIQLIQDKDRLYKNLTIDIINNGLDSDGMRIIYENLYNAMRLQGRGDAFLNIPGPAPQSPIEEKGK